MSFPSPESAIADRRKGRNCDRGRHRLRDAPLHKVNVIRGILTSVAILLDAMNADFGISGDLPGRSDAMTRACGTLNWMAQGSCTATATMEKCPLIRSGWPFAKCGTARQISCGLVNPSNWAARMGLGRNKAEGDTVDRETDERAR
jgi:hypothetical protein